MTNKNTKTLLSCGCNKSAERNPCPRNGCNYCAGHYPPADLDHCARCIALPHSIAEYDRQGIGKHDEIFIAPCPNPNCGWRQEFPCADNYASCPKCGEEFITDEEENIGAWKEDRAQNEPSGEAEITDAIRAAGFCLDSATDAGGVGTLYYFSKDGKKYAVEISEIEE